LLLKPARVAEIQTMQTLTRIADLRETVTNWRLGRESIAFVPTMGNLHLGHASLMAAAHTHGRRVISSIFVNPMQFGPSEDFSAYPRTPDDDSNLLEEYGVDALFHPTVDEMYPEGSVGSTVVDVPGLTDILCGSFRPGHFQGVATVVVKLLCLVQPDVAIFGEKDFQQLTVIRRVVQDLVGGQDAAILAQGAAGGEIQGGPVQVGDAPPGLFQHQRASGLIPDLLAVVGLGR
jgi:pantoate--beta-alanine ligase